MQLAEQAAQIAEGLQLGLHRPEEEASYPCSPRSLLACPNQSSAVTSQVLEFRVECERVHGWKLCSHVTFVEPARVIQLQCQP